MKPIVSQINGVMQTLRNWNKADAYKHLIPQRVEDGIIYNIVGNPLGSCQDCEDKEIVPAAALENLSRVTAQFQEMVFSKVSGWMASEFGDDEEEDEPTIDEEEDEPTIDEEEDEPTIDEEEDEPTIDEEEDEPTIEAEIARLIDEGELKEAKKLLKANKENLPKKVYKALKKEIKNG